MRPAHRLSSSGHRKDSDEHALGQPLVVAVLSSPHSEVPGYRSVTGERLLHLLDGLVHREARRLLVDSSKRCRTSRHRCRRRQSDPLQGRPLRATLRKPTIAAFVGVSFQDGSGSASADIGLLCSTVSPSSRPSELDSNSQWADVRGGEPITVRQTRLRGGTCSPWLLPYSFKACDPTLHAQEVR